MLVQEIIRKKRDGHILAADEISYLIDAARSWDLSDGQIAAFAMATHVRGMAHEEIVALTHALAHSGTTFDWHQNLDGPVMDYHSVGGVGDKTPLIVPALVAACSGIVPVIGSRSAHHVGGTLDKLSAIPGYETNASFDLLRQTVKNAGCAIIGQTNELVPATRRFCSLMGVTATADSIPMITASILSRSLALGVDGMVVNIPIGNGAFMETQESARALASALVATAGGVRVPLVALITDMNQVLGMNAGNALEVQETVDFLTGLVMEPRLHKAVMATASNMLIAGGLAYDLPNAYSCLEKALATGRAADCFARMVHGLGGPGNILSHAERHLPEAKIKKPVAAPETGRVTAVDTRQIGMAILDLGGGRTLPGARIDPAVGLSNIADPGRKIGKGDALLYIHANDEEKADYFAKDLQKAFTIDPDVTTEVPSGKVVYEVMRGDDDG